MAKRFTDTEKWKKKFIRGLDIPYKLLYFYILDDCDHAGIWHVDIEVAKIRTGVVFDEAVALERFKEKIHVFDDGEKWFLPDFIEFQYGNLNPDNRAHKSVLDRLGKYNLDKVLISPLQGAMDKDKEKDKVKDKEEAKVVIPDIHEFLDHAMKLCVKSGRNFMALKFSIEQKYEAWKDAGWKDGHGNKIKVWKTKLGNTLPHLKEIQSTKKAGLS